MYRLWTHGIALATTPDVMALYFTDIQFILLYKNTAMQRGFSLVELSIVLVILGLLTGGILAGQSLIRAAELRSVNTEVSRYTTAAQTFRDKYFALPGDMINATKFWGDDNAACPDPLITNGTPGTCNGTGDGDVNYATAANATSEIFQFWKQLALAGLIEGSYSGLSGPAGLYNVVAGVNVPRSRLNNASWHASTNRNYPGDADTYQYDLASYYLIQAAASGQPVLTPEEAWNIDTKFDDGKPASGKVIAKYWNNLCSAPNSGAATFSNLNASYRLSDRSVQCALYFTNAF